MNSLLKRTSLLAISGVMTTTLFAQEVPKGWHMLDKSSGFYGVSVDKAYSFLQGKKLKSNTVIVAVIDSGIDTTHEDLKGVLWSNPKEIPGNGIDDDKNGYIDDIHGWNFLGSRDGSKNVEQDSYEMARVYYSLKNKWEGKDVDVTKLSKEERFEYEMWARAKKEVTASDPGDPKLTPEQMAKLKARYTEMMADDSTVRAAMKKETYTGKDLESFQSSDLLVTKAKKNIVGFFKANGMMEVKASDFLGEFGDYVESQEKKLESEGKAPANYRDDVVQDNYNDFNDKFYGNGNVQVSNKSALHGTHVSGIIAASRNNGVGMDGIADNVKIMMLRAVPDGDEHDKDIALAIRYAVDNGAQVINMSFGKGFSPEKNWVDEAVKYAESKGVLLVHAAGNDAKNVDTTFNYPSPSFVKDGKRAGNWITVGASGPNNENGNSLRAGFSNYGKKEVDVFAPGVKIYATVPGGNVYRDLQGTSMASPVVAGVAALILQYFPNLSAQQVKMVIEKSSQKPDMKVKNPETQESVSLGELSKYGGIVNAFEAVKLASTLKGERKVTKPAKSTVKPKVRG